MIILLVLLVLFASVLWHFIRRQYTYWTRLRHDFPCDTRASIPFGSLKTVAKHEQSMGMAIYDIYRRYSDRYIGVYLLFRPGLLVRDVNLVRQILAQDFAHFHDRGVYVDEENDPLSANLFSLRGQSWRTMRTKLAPSFSSGKLKGMFGTCDDIGDKMLAHLRTLVPSEGDVVEIDIMDVTTTYAIDIVASVIFGLDINSFDHPQNKFRALVTQVRRNNLFSAIFGMLIFLCPSVAKFLFKLGFKNTVVSGLRDIISETVEYREKHNIVRRDLLQMLMQIRNNGKVNLDDENWAFQTPAEKFVSMSMDTIAAHAFIFYVAGQGTTATTAAFTLFELAQYPELLERAQRDVEDTLARYGGIVSYEALQTMEFLELCILETLRKYPGLPLLNRECTENYQIPGTDDIIEKGTPVVISLLGIHRDPEHFPHPETYDPERFLEDRHDYNANAYMPFGEGPRHCIAQRMGKINAKLAVVKILQHFHLELMSRREIEIDNHSIAIVPKNGVKVRLRRKEKL